MDLASILRVSAALGAGTAIVIVAFAVPFLLRRAAIRGEIQARLAALKRANPADIPKIVGEYDEKLDVSAKRLSEPHRYDVTLVALRQREARDVRKFRLALLVVLMLSTIALVGIVLHGDSRPEPRRPEASPVAAAPAEGRPRLGPARETLYSLFWLGSRIQDSLVLLGQSEPLAPEKRGMLRAALVTSFEKRSLTVPVGVSFREFLDRQTGSESNDEKSQYRRTFAQRGLESVERAYASEGVLWWSLGWAISALRGCTGPDSQGLAVERAVGKCVSALNLTSAVLAGSSVPGEIATSVDRWRVDLAANPKVLQEHPQRTKDLARALGTLLLTGGSTEANLENARLVLDADPILAVVLLKRFLAENSKSSEGYFLVGKACAQALQATPNVDPLFSEIDITTTMRWSLKNFLELNPDGADADKARELLRLLDHVLDGSSNASVKRQ